MILKYLVQSLEPVRTNLFTDELLIEDQKWDFWVFLNMPVIQQLEQLAIQWLKNQNLFKRNNQEIVSFKTFDTDSIIKTISKQVICYIQHFNEEPKYIIIGPDVHQQLFIESSKSYQQELWYRMNGQDYLLGVAVILVRHMEGGFLLMPELPHNRDLEVAKF